MSGSGTVADPILVSDDESEFEPSSTLRLRRVMEDDDSWECIIIDPEPEVPASSGAAREDDSGVSTSRSTTSGSKPTCSLATFSSKTPTESGVKNRVVTALDERARFAAGEKSGEHVKKIDLKHVFSYQLVLRQVRA